MSMRSLCLGVVVCCTLVSMVGCTAPGETVQEKRDNIQRMKGQGMALIIDKYPETKQLVDSAPGYAVLKTFTAGLIPGGGSGYGVLVDNRTGEQTYLQMGQFSLGVILMVKDGYTLLVFDDPTTMNEFKTEKWLGGAAADATFNFGEFGWQANATGYFGKGVRVYELTDNGVALRAYLPLIKYSPYNQLNGGPTTTAPTPAK